MNVLDAFYVRVLHGIEVTKVSMEYEIMKAHTDEIVITITRYRGGQGKYNNTIIQRSCFEEKDHSSIQMELKTKSFDQYHSTYYKPKPHPDAHS